MSPIKNQIIFKLFQASNLNATSSLSDQTQSLGSSEKKDPSVFFDPDTIDQDYELFDFVVPSDRITRFHEVNSKQSDERNKYLQGYMGQSLEYEDKDVEETKQIFQEALAKEGA